MAVQLTELIENMAADKASMTELFGDAGMSVRHQVHGPDYADKLAGAAKFISEVYRGKRRPSALIEAMTTSDFPLLFGDILDRQVLANYQESPQTFKNYVRMTTVNDFRQVTRFGLSGAEGSLDLVPQLTEYPQADLSELRYQYQVQKYGRVVQFSWEAMINDELQTLQDIPERLGKASRRTEERFVTGMYVGVNGPHATMFTGGNGNIITGNPGFGMVGLATAFGLLSTAVDAEGEPITFDMVELVVPPALVVSAQNILNATEIWSVGENGATAGTQLHSANWMKSIVRLSVNPYIPIVASTANGATSWFLFANPNNGRPALEVAHLRGHETPELFMKSPNAVRIGGGAVSPMDGDFDTDSIMYKVRHVFGGGRLDPRMALASNGTGAP